MAERFTERQGEYLAFIHLYITLNKRSPAESDFQAYFRVSAPSVHSMIVSLTNLGLIQRTPGRPVPFACGMDVGLEKFASLSDGAFIENPRFFRNDEKALAKAQKKASLLKHARSQEQKAKRRKANKVVARIHERIRNRRHDFIHQLSRKLVNKYGLIELEKLNIKNMMASPKAKPDTENPGEFLPMVMRQSPA